MISGEKWMLMCRSGPCSSLLTRSSIAPREGRRRRGRSAAPPVPGRRPALPAASRPPREGRAHRGPRGRAGRPPHPGAGVRLGARRGGRDDGLDRLQPVPRGPAAVRPRSVLRHRRPLRPPGRRRARRSLPVPGPDDAAPPARAGRAARAAVPRPQDPGRRALPLLRARLPSLRGVSDPVADLHAAVERAAGEVANGTLKSRPTLERPKQAEHGDYSTNVAMLLAPLAGAPPREVAAQVGEQLRVVLGDRLAGLDIAGPGFINLRLADDWYAAALRGVLDAGERFGTREPRGERALVEFV